MWERDLGLNPADLRAMWCSSIMPPGLGLGIVELKDGARAPEVEATLRSRLPPRATVLVSRRFVAFAFSFEDGEEVDKVQRHIEARLRSKLEIP
jgi:hypothetical protein